MENYLKSALISFLLAFSFCGNAYAIKNTISHGVSIFGDLKYPKNFKNFDYVNPKAPKGGTVKIAAIGTYDTLNPYIIKGVAASGLNYTFDTLTVNSSDETSSAYGLIAKSIEIDKSRNWVIFTLRDIAKWHDNSKITADDVVFSFNTITKKGHPYYRAYYQEIEKAEKLAYNKVKFTFLNNKNKELPLIIGGLPIISKAYYQKNDFEKVTLKAPLGSGAYKVNDIKPGRSISYKRFKNYWGKNLSVNKGKYNFDEIIIDYYRDATVAIEALKAGEYDFRRENISKNWKKAYEIPHINDGRMIKEEVKDSTPTGMQAFIFNIRRSNFKNPIIREAISYAYDYEWANKQLFYSAYARNVSFFGNSSFASSGLPSKGELKLLEPFKDQLPTRLFTSKYQPPKTNGDGNARDNLLIAQKLIKDAGWHLNEDMLLVNPETNKVVTIEFLLTSPSFERVVAPFVRNLKRLGITSNIRMVDSSQYIKKREDFDFDIMIHWFTQGPVPGNEQINYWHSSKADINGSFNLIGIKNPVIDNLVEKMVSANSKQELITATKALDRVLLWNFYVIPQWHSRTHRIIYWNKFGKPSNIAPYSLGFLDTWWIDNKKYNQLQNILQGK